jgi:soluble lytic murein transglycosylase-like protein
VNPSGALGTALTAAGCVRASALPQGLVLAAIAAGLVAAPARADVIDIGEDGGATMVLAPSLVHSTDMRDAQPLVALQSAPSAYSRAAPVADLTSHTQVIAIIRDAAVRVGLPSSLVTAVAWEESRLHPRAISPRGALGVMQLMPATARGLGVDATDIQANIHGGALYLRQMVNRYGGDVSRALAAYNAGPGAVDRYGGVPPYSETRRYVANIMGRLVKQDGFATWTAAQPRNTP